MVSSRGVIPKQVPLYSKPSNYQSSAANVGKKEAHARIVHLAVQQHLPKPKKQKRYARQRDGLVVRLVGTYTTLAMFSSAHLAPRCSCRCMTTRRGVAVQTSDTPARTRTRVLIVSHALHCTAAVVAAAAASKIRSIR